MHVCVSSSDDGGGTVAYACQFWSQILFARMKPCVGEIDPTSAIARLLGEEWTLLKNPHYIRHLAIRLIIKILKVGTWPQLQRLDVASQNSDWWETNWIIRPGGLMKEQNTAARLSLKHH